MQQTTTTPPTRDLQLYAGDPAVMLYAGYNPQLRREIGSPFHRTVPGPHPLVSFETGRHPSLRVFQGELKERFVQLFADILYLSTHADAGNALAPRQPGAERFSSLPARERLLIDMSACELVDNVMLLNDEALVALRLTGKQLLKTEGIGEDREKVGQFLREELVLYLGQEGKHAIRSIAELTRTIFPVTEVEPELPLSIKQLVDLPDDTFTGTLARLFALMKPADFERLHVSASREVSGLPPIFRIFSPADFVALSDFELKGWMTSKELELGGPTHAGYVSWATNHSVLEKDKPFRVLLTLQHVRTMRFWGPEILTALTKVGTQMSEIGFLYEPTEFPKIMLGVPLADGTVATLPENLAILIGFYRHEAWIVERERSQLCNDAEYVQPEHWAHKHFDPTVTPGPEYLYDIVKAYGFAHALSGMVLHKDPVVKGLYRKLAQAVNEDGDNKYGQDVSTVMVLLNSPESVTREQLTAPILNPKPLETSEQLLHSSGFSFYIPTHHSRPNIDEIAVFMKRRMLIEERCELRPVFNRLDALDCFPLAAPCHSIVQKLFAISEARDSLIREMVLGLSEIGGWQCNKILRNNELTLWEILDSFRGDAKRYTEGEFQKYRAMKEDVNLMGAQERYKSTVSLIPEEDNAPALELVRELISSKVTPDNLPELSFRGGVVDDLYSLKFLSCYRRQGNHILTQLSGHTGRRHPEGIVLVGASGVWDPSFERLVEGLRLSDSFRLTELIVTASDRPAGTYQRLLRAMAAYIALSGGTASLGFVHERNEKHKSLLEASGHRLFSSNKFILSHRDDKRLHRYIPAWLNLI